MNILGFLSSDNATPAVLLGLAIVLIMIGGLVPRPYYKEKIAEAERWRTAYEIERGSRIKASDQTTELLETAKTTGAIVQALFRTQHPSGTGDPHVVPQAPRD